MKTWIVFFLLLNLFSIFTSIFCLSQTLCKKNDTDSGVTDCLDSFDEIDCEKLGNDYDGFQYKYVQSSCPENYFVCFKSSNLIGEEDECFKSSSLCDGITDCENGSDEVFCPYDPLDGYLLIFNEVNCTEKVSNCFKASDDTSLSEAIYHLSCLNLYLNCECVKSCSDNEYQKFCSFLFKNTFNKLQATDKVLLLEEETTVARSTKTSDLNSKNGSLIPPTSLFTTISPKQWDESKDETVSTYNFVSPLNNFSDKILSELTEISTFQSTISEKYSKSTLNIIPSTVAYDTPTVQPNSQGKIFYTSFGIIVCVMIIINTLMILTLSSVTYMLWRWRKFCLNKEERQKQSIMLSSRLKWEDV